MIKKLQPGAYCGHTANRFSGNGLSLGETIFTPDLLIPQHEHANPFFCFVLEGQGTRSWPGRNGQEAPMHLTLFPGELPHANGWYAEGGRALHIEFSSPWLERLSERTDVLLNPLDVKSGPPIWLAQRLAQECFQQDDLAALAIEGLALELVVACARSQSQSRASIPVRWLEGVKAHLSERFTESLSLEQIATEFHVSADHLNREFRRRYGCTVGDYLRQLRLDYACRHLARSEMSLAEIALSAGFSDQSHLTRLFHRHMGTTPAAYRRLMSGDRFCDKDIEAVQEARKPRS